MDRVSVNFKPTRQEAIDILNAALKGQRLNGRKKFIIIASLFIIADSVYAIINTGNVKPQNVIFIVIGILFIVYALFLAHYEIVKKYAADITAGEVTLVIDESGIELSGDSESEPLKITNITEIVQKKVYLNISHTENNKTKLLLLPIRIFNSTELDCVMRLLGRKDGITNE